jgi:hypothetical protein
MDRFGVKKPSLRAIARTPEIPPLQDTAPEKETEAREPAMGWRGMTLADLTGEDFSAFGVSKSDGGVHIVEGPSLENAGPDGLAKGDLIISLDGEAVRNRREFFQALAKLGTGSARGKLVRNQKPADFKIAGDLARETSRDGSFPTLKPAPAPLHRINSRSTTSNEPLHTLTDGALAPNYGAIFQNAAAQPGYKLDLGQSQSLHAVNAWTFNMNGTRGAIRAAVFGSNAKEDPGWNVEDRSRFTPLTVIDTRGEEAAAYNAASHRLAPGMPNEFRWIVWIPLPLNEIGEYSAFQEFGVETE